MKFWTDEAIILSLRPHGETGAVVALLSAQQGRCVGYLPGGQSRSRRQGMDVGARVQARWQARLLDQMGTFELEPIRQTAAPLLGDPLRLSALISACALCDSALPEREPHPALYAGLGALLEALPEDHWAPGYVVWELALMKELGYALDLSRCVAGGSSQDLAYVSPKSGCAVSREHGDLYKTRLLPLPEFLKSRPWGESGPGPGSLDDVQTGLTLTAWFLEHWVFAHHARELPEARTRLASQLARHLEKSRSPADVA